MGLAILLILLFVNAHVAADNNVLVVDAHHDEVRPNMDIQDESMCSFLTFLLGGFP